jgi:HD-like signal output (HDOD) protein
MPTPDDFFTRPPADLAGWVARFDASRLPVLQDSADALEELRAIEDDVDAHGLAEAVGTDPLLTLKLLAHVAKLRRGREGSDPETVTAALVMLGIPPFFRAFGDLPTVETRLAPWPEALAGFRAVLRRAHRGANFAIGFAAHRLDPDAAVIHEAALLHDFAELLLWLHAPALALQIAARQAADPSLRSADVQRELLHITLADLQHALMVAWKLPELLVRITDEQRQADAQVRNVLLAMRVARHSAAGWDNPALPSDVDEVAALLHLGTEPTWRLLHDIDGA